MIQAILSFLKNTNLPAWQQIILDLIVAALIFVLGFAIKELFKLLIRFVKWLYGKVSIRVRIITKPWKEKRQRIKRFRLGQLKSFDDVNYLINKADNKMILSKLEASLIDRARELKKQEPIPLLTEKQLEDIKKYIPDYSAIKEINIQTNIPKFIRKK